MGKDKGSRILALAALLVGVIGLSLGFAAFSSTLNITSEANVQVGTKWNVGFATTNSATHAPLAINDAESIAGTITGTETTGTSGGTIDLLKYTVTQGTPAVLNTAAGTSVTYNFDVLNLGDIDALLDSVTMGSLTCAYASSNGARTVEQDERNIGATVTAGEGTITDSDCQTMFTATLTIGGTPYTTSQSGISGVTLAKVASAPNNRVAASLTIASTGTTPSNVPTGDFTVSLGATTVNYKSN